MANKPTIAGNTFMFTGTLTHLKRAAAEGIVKDNGGTILSGVTAKLNILVVGEDAGSKLEKAKKLGTVKILTEKEFMKMVPANAVVAAPKANAAKAAAPKVKAVKAATPKAKAAKPAAPKAKAVKAAAPKAKAMKAAAPKAKTPTATSNGIVGRTFMFTGTLTSLKRAEVESLVKENGGTIISGVTAKLNILVVGEDAGSKLEKAKKLGTVKILTEKEFMKMLPKVAKVSSSIVAKSKVPKEKAVKHALPANKVVKLPTVDSDAELSDILGKKPIVLTSETIHVPRFFSAACIGETDFDDILDALAEETEDGELEYDDNWGAWEEDADFDFDHITSDEHKRMLRFGISFAELVKLYSKQHIIEDLSDCGVVVYRRKPKESAYILNKTSQIAKVFDKHPETMINVVLISYSDGA
jgi:BRCT domain type II-containing protein